MKRFFSSKPFEIISFTVLVIIFGAGFGVFIQGYWLVDFFPAASGRLLYFTVLSCLLGMAGYLLIFRWLRNRLMNVSRQQLAVLIGSSILIGAFFFFTTTDRWQKPIRYATLLLPEHTFEISISSAQPSGKVFLLWFNTSVGDISFDDLDYHGWKWENDRFILTDFSNNWLRWAGKPGAEAQIVFRSTFETGDVVVSWDGQKSALPLIKRQYSFVQAFNIPFYASKGWLFLLGILNFAVLSLPLCLLIWEKRSELLPSLSFTLSEAPHPFNRNEVPALLLVIGLASLLRVPNLGVLFPVTDEYQHLIAAKQIVQGVSWQAVYQRSLWVVTLPVALAFKIFGYKIWAARLVGVCFNILAIIPLYLISRKINRTVAILSTLLYATSPLIVALSRDVREYAYYPFYFYWIVYGLILVLEQIRDRFRNRESWKSLFAPGHILLALALLMPPLYALYIDTFSTFKLILIAYVMFGIFMPLMMDMRIWNNLLVIVVVVGVLPVSAYFLLRHFSLALTFDPAPLNYFFPNPPQQWYFNRLIGVPEVMLLAGISASLFAWRRNFAPLFLTVLFSCFVGFFVFSSVNHSEPRHLSMAQLWYIILIAIGLYVFWRFLQTFTFFAKGSIKYVAGFVLIVLSINSQQILLPVTAHDPYVPITGHYHTDLEQVHKFLLANSQKEDVLISTDIYAWYVDWVDGPDFSVKYLVGIDTQLDYVLSIIARHNSGWIVLDKVWIHRFAFSPLESFSANKTLKYAGLFGDEYLWHWKTK